MNTAAVLTKAANEADAYFERKRAEERIAKFKWELDSRKRFNENGLSNLLCPVSGRVDSGFVAELPLTLGYNTNDDGCELAYVALGGVDISAYLPPDVLADIQSHIEESWSEESHDFWTRD